MTSDNCFQVQVELSLIVVSSMSGLLIGVDVKHGGLRLVPTLAEQEMPTEHPKGFA